ncbi:cysteine-rich protein 2-binding protein [Coccinella septempunctata]|uniref:cysteine-rich protein 2-binding protein n=1 Tax=Coccinella septempunctata TaxID=41139 RepID=UPI001D067D34|nr:cysteine-rich protein 2-binding protein [Coccinella septempunctata]XP_044746332.1 cysteine-rich protein 2-binding protein [Coccinella septempunctata]
MENCKYCEKPLEDCEDEGLQCTTCLKYVHVRCLKRGAVPGGMNGDLFFTYTCQECSESNTEVFVRDKLSWLQVIVLVLYHLNTKSPGLAKKGFFHWKFQIAAFIEKNWEALFTKYVKKKKSWTGTVAGTISHFSKYFFLSGTSVIKQQAWWTLRYPKLSPHMISKIYNSLMAQKIKFKADKQAVSDIEIFNQILEENVKNPEMLQPFMVNEMDIQEDTAEISGDLGDILSPSQIEKTMKEKENKETNKRKSLLPSIDNKKFLKLSNSPESLSDDFTRCSVEAQDKKQLEDILKHKKPEEKKENFKLLDPFCHYNTSLSNISRMKGISLKIKLLGGVRKEMILSPYSGIYLKPYIRRDTETFPSWLQMMAELQLTANKKDSTYTLPSRGPLDFVYVQPEHIPAINCLCNQFFWPGIDLTDTLQYPDFSCVVVYRRLIVGFAFLVPNVSHTENYISFIFTRPGWRNVGIATFMLYHLIQTSQGKDILLHVSINNPAFFLYQKFGFKVEKIVLDFYDKYIRDDVKESKHAFLCRYER